MFQLQSTRLRLIPLTLDQLQLLAISRNKLELSIGLNPSTIELNASKSFIEEFESDVWLHSYVLPMVSANQAHYEWYTHWLIVHQEHNLTVGGIGVNGLPDENGQVMMGYYIDKKYEGQGIATEAVQCLLHWLFQHERLQLVVADTPVDNYGSQKVLQKNGFTFAGEVEEGFRWIFKR